MKPIAIFIAEKLENLVGTEDWLLINNAADELRRLQAEIERLKAPQRKPLTDEQKSILNFLLGADDFEGVWYGDKHPHKKGAFWWRDELRKAFQPSTKENGPTGQNGAVITSVKPDVTWKLNKLYTTPPQRKPLTDEEIILIVAECAASHQHTDIHFARAIERAHGIKELV